MSEVPSHKDLVQSEVLLDQALAFFDECASEIDDLLPLHPHSYDQRQAAIVQRSLHFGRAMFLLHAARNVSERELNQLGDDILRSSDVTKADNGPSTL